jgi:hypothetical protein
MNIKISTRLIIITALIVICLAASFYLWQTFLSDHYLGGYDEDGMHIQYSETGLYFFWQTWPLWIFPLILVILLMWIVKLYMYYVVENKISALEAKVDEKNKKLDQLQHDLNLSNSKNKRTQLNQKKQKNRVIKKLKNDYKELNTEFENLIKEYKKSQQFILKS